MSDFESCKWCGKRFDPCDGEYGRYFYRRGWATLRFCSQKCRREYEADNEELIEATQERKEYEKTPEYKQKKAKRLARISAQHEERRAEARKKTLIGRAINLLPLLVLIICTLIYFRTNILMALVFGVLAIWYLISFFKEDMADDFGFLLQWLVRIAVVLGVCFGLKYLFGC